MYDSGTTQFTSNVMIDRNLAVTGSMHLITFLPSKHWFCFLVLTDSVGAFTISKHIGYNTTGISCSHTINGGYDFTHPAHPNGANFLIMLTLYSTSSGTVTTIPTGYGQIATKSFVYCKNPC